MLTIISPLVKLSNENIQNNVVKSWPKKYSDNNNNNNNNNNSNETRFKYIQYFRLTLHLEMCNCRMLYVYVCLHGSSNVDNTKCCYCYLVAVVVYFFVVQKYNSTNCEY